MRLAYAASQQLGSVGKIYDLLVEAGNRSPISGNQDGSFLTMRSNGGLLFGACTIASGFSGVFCDQGYWQRAIASRPQSTTTAYTLGGLSWFAIPWGKFRFTSLLGVNGEGAEQVQPSDQLWDLVQPRWK